MKRILVLAAGLTLGLPLAGAQAADSVTIQLKWVSQAQFAGYFVAKSKGFYKEAGLDVTIKPGGPDVAPPQVIAGGGAAFGQYFADVQTIRIGTDLPRRHGHQEARRPQEQNSWDLVRRQ